MSARRLWLTTSVMLVSGCTSGKSDTGEPVDPSPCADGSWGAITDPGGALYVAEDGDDGAVGTRDAPLATLAAALEIARTASQPEIFIGPGSYGGTQVLLGTDEGTGGDDNGRTIQGCPSDTILEADEDQVLKVSGSNGLTLAGLRLEGGVGPLWIWQGAGVTLTDLEITKATTYGVVIDGVDTLVSANTMDISGVVASEVDDGVVAGLGMVVDRSTLTLSHATINGGTRYGLLLIGDGEAGDFTLDDVSVGGTVSDPHDGTLGRGIQIQSAAQFIGTDLSLENNQDAGLYAVTSASVTLAGLSVDGVDESEIGDGHAAADGVVITGQDGEHDYAASDFSATLDGVSVVNALRAGIVVERATVTDAKSTTADSFYAQDGGSVSGADAGLVTELSGADMFTFNRELFNVSLDGG